MISIRIERLTKRFGGQVALDGVSFTIEPGEIFFLLGPSGCGKTTLLRSIAGFCVPDDGRVYFGDEDVTFLPPHRRNTGMMFQSYALWPHLTVAKNVAFGLEERRVPRRDVLLRVAEALESVKMGAYAERKIAQLSGGQQQRVALARALVVRPRALLLDEPLSNLDAKLRLEMRAEIRRVCKESGLTAVYVTHDQKEALSISDRMAVLENGKIAQIGRPTEVYRFPQSKAVADFIGETNFLSGRVVAGTGEGTLVETPVGIFRGFASEPDWSPVSGETVTLSIRPECWTLGKVHSTGEASGQPNLCSGHVASTVYLGEVAQHHFVSGGADLKVFEMNPQASSHPPDREQCLTVDSRDVVILRR